MISENQKSDPFLSHLACTFLLEDSPNTHVKCTLHNTHNINLINNSLLVF